MQNSLLTSKKQKGPVGARLFVIFARRAHVAVIFRRGPSKWVQLIKWNTDNDTFEPGQWFHGRIYEKRCDLSPDGSLLVYFAQKISARTLKDKAYTYVWTAISKPPYLTALALWPKGDCWNGGGLFRSDKALALYHAPATKAHPEHKPPRWLHVTLTDHGRGEDDPIFSDRLERDGWKLEQEWKVESRGYPKWYHTEQPEIRRKLNRNQKSAVQLIRAINRLDYTEEFFAVTDKGTCVAPITRASWADWDQNGRLVFCKDGRVYAATLGVAGDWKEAELANFNSSKPVPLPAPRSATIW
jgi:hypothetical protein